MHRLASIGFSVVVLLMAACTASPEQGNEQNSVRGTETPGVTATTSTSMPVAGWHSGSIAIGVEGRPLGVWSYASGFVLAAAVETDGDRRLAIWRSVDGLHWEGDSHLGPLVERTPTVDVGPSGRVAVATGESGYHALAILEPGSSWTTHRPDEDWGPLHWGQLDGNEYVDTGFAFDDIELGPQGVLVALTRRSSLDYQQAVRDALPDLTSAYEEIWVSVDHESGEVELAGIRELPDSSCSMCGPCIHWDVASEPLGIFSLQDVGIDPTLAIEVRNHSHARWIWQSADLGSWTLSEMRGNGEVEHQAVGLFLDVGVGYVASIGGDFGYSGDGVDWTYWDRRSEDRYFSVRDLAWTGSEVVVGSGAHNAIGPAQDSYDIWAGTFDDLRPVVVAPQDSLLDRAYPSMRVYMAAGPVGTVVVGTDEDSERRLSTVWILRPDGRVRHETTWAGAVAAGSDRVVVLGAVAAAQQGSICESTLSFETYVASGAR